MDSPDMIELKDQFNHAAFQLQVEEGLQKKNAEKLKDIVDRMQKIHQMGLDTQNQRNFEYMEKIRQEEIKFQKESVKKLIEDFTKVKMLQESDFIDNSMQSTADESLIMQQQQRPPKSVYDQVKEDIISFQK